MKLPACTGESRGDTLGFRLRRTAVFSTVVLMRSPFLALLLIVNLLTCPVRCLSCEAKVTVGEECASPACSCCSYDNECPKSEAPKPCGNDCDCKNCICEGAVVEADDELPSQAAQSVVWVVPAMAANQTTKLLVSISSRRSFAPVGQLLCGRDVRVAHQSWLS